MDKLYADTASLYRLNQGGLGTGGGRDELGPLPAEAVTLLVTLGAVWVILGLLALRDALKKKQAAARGNG